MSMSPQADLSPLGDFALMTSMWWVMMIAMMLPAAAPMMLLYAGTGVLTMLLGENFLAYDIIVPESTHHAGQHYGILLVEFGVGLAVEHDKCLAELVVRAAMIGFEADGFPKTPRRCPRLT